MYRALENRDVEVQRWFNDVFVRRYLWVSYYFISCSYLNVDRQRFGIRPSALHGVIVNVDSS